MNYASVTKEEVTLYLENSLRIIRMNIEEFRIEDISWYNGSLERFHLDRSRCRLEEARLLSLLGRTRNLGRFPVFYPEVTSNRRRKLINYRD